MLPMFPDLVPETRRRRKRTCFAPLPESGQVVLGASDTPYAPAVERKEVELLFMGQKDAITIDEDTKHYLYVYGYC